MFDVRPAAGKDKVWSLARMLRDNFLIKDYCTEEREQHAGAAAKIACAHILKLYWLFLEVPKKYLKFGNLRCHVRMDGEGYKPQDFTCRPMVS